MHIIIVIFIIIINIISINFGKAINYENDSSNTNYTNISNNEYLSSSNSQNPLMDYNTVKTKNSFNIILKKLCDIGKNDCSIEFKQMGPFTFDGYTECYIHSPYSGPDDKQTAKGNGFIKIFMNINAKLMCVVNGKTYNEVQRVNIFGYNNRLPVPSDFKPGTILTRGTNTFINEKSTYTIILSDCTNVWSYRESLDLNCECDKIVP